MKETKIDSDPSVRHIATHSYIDEIKGIDHLRFRMIDLLLVGAPCEPPFLRGL